jgi:glycosyltransferase involved in cell wall biosynthesis
MLLGADGVTPLISVAVPLFNKRSYIGDSLASVAAQSFSDYEIIVVDDGSTDDGASVVEALKLSNLKLIRQKNAGVSAARNRCLAEASSEFVAFLDADDIWRRDHLRHLWDLHVAYPEARLLANAYREVQAASAVRVGPADVAYRSVPDFIAEAAADRSWVFTSAAMVHREACISVGGFEVGESRGEDIDLWIRMALKFPVALSGYVGCLYRRVDNSLSNSHSLVEPDIAMRRIAGFLEADTGMSSDRKRDLKEFYNRVAITNSTDCLMKGQRAAARKFLALASDTHVLRRRWLFARFLCLLPPQVVFGLGRFRGWARSVMEG